MAVIESKIDDVNTQDGEAGVSVKSVKKRYTDEEREIICKDLSEITVEGEVPYGAYAQIARLHGHPVCSVLRIWKEQKTHKKSGHFMTQTERNDICKELQEMIVDGLIPNGSFTRIAEKYGRSISGIARMWKKNGQGGGESRFKFTTDEERMEIYAELKNQSCEDGKIKAKVFTQVARKYERATKTIKHVWNRMRIMEETGKEDNKLMSTEERAAILENLTSRRVDGGELAHGSFANVANAHGRSLPAVINLWKAEHSTETSKERKTKAKRRKITPALV